MGTYNKPRLLLGVLGEIQTLAVTLTATSHGTAVATAGTGADQSTQALGEIVTNK